MKRGPRLCLAVPYLAITLAPDSRRLATSSTFANVGYMTPRCFAAGESSGGPQICQRQISTKACSSAAAISNEPTWAGIGQNTKAQAHEEFYAQQISPSFGHASRPAARLPARPHTRTHAPTHTHTHPYPHPHPHPHPPPPHPHPHTSIPQRVVWHIRVRDAKTERRDRFDCFMASDNKINHERITDRAIGPCKATAQHTTQNGC